MTLVTSKKSSKKTIQIKKESAYDKVKRQNNELRKKEQLAAYEKELADQQEILRLRSLIIPYLDNLDAQLHEKESMAFWTFPDRSGFKKYKNKNVRDMQKLVSKDPEQYANRHLAKISFKSYHYEKISSEYGKSGIMFAVGISILPIDKNGILNGKDNAFGLDFNWRYNDFKITKFSLKLIERIMQLVTTKEITGTHFIGMSLHIILDRIKKLGYDFIDVLHPLAGV